MHCACVCGHALCIAACSNVAGIPELGIMGSVSESAWENIKTMMRKVQGFELCIFERFGRFWNLKLK